MVLPYLTLSVCVYVLIKEIESQVLQISEFMWRDFNERKVGGKNSTGKKYLMFTDYFSFWIFVTNISALQTDLISDKDNLTNAKKEEVSIDFLYWEKKKLSKLIWLKVKISFQPFF